MKLAHEILLALAYVSQITDPDAVRERFVESLNELDETYGFEFSYHPPQGVSESRVCPIATLHSSFGYAVMAEDPDASETERSALRNAFRLLAVLLENRQQQQALRSEYQSLRKELSQEKSMVRTVLSTLPVGAWVADANGTILMANAAGERIWGAIRYVGPDRYSDYTAWWADTGDAVKPEEWPLSRALATGGMIMNQEMQIESFDGLRKTILVSAAPILDAQEGVVGAVAVTQDVTERTAAESALRESEARFKAMFEMASIGLAQADPQTGRLLRVNTRLCEMLGYSPDEMLAATFPEITHPDDRAEDWAAFQSVVRGEAPYFRREKRYIRKDGSVLWASLNVTVLRDTNGELVHTMAAIEDITERKHAEEDKAKLQDQLVQAQKMESVGRLAGGVAHDFNNTLSVILGYAEMAMDQLTPDQPLHDELQEIRKAAGRSAELTRQLLAFARRQPVSPRVLDVNETIEGMLRMLQRVIGEDIDLLWKPGEDLWSIHIDPSQLDQILANLCVNARDAITGVGKITIETQNAAIDDAYCAQHLEFSSADYVLLAVSDNGCGMDRETLERVFEPFFTTKGMGGTGLGLATVYGIVKQNNGLINSYSEPGMGTTFKIYLPRYLGESEPVPAEETRVLQGGGETVLIVEDEPAILRLAQLMLESAGYHVLSAGLPGDALELAKNHIGAIDLLITDVVMPEMDGRDLAKRILAFRPSLKHLFMSGYTANVIVHHGVLDAGVHFIQKPFDRQSLMLKVRETLSHQ